MVLKSLMGLGPSELEERRVGLDRWLQAALQAANSSSPWARAHLHAFLHVPAVAAAVAPTPVVSYSVPIANASTKP